MKEAVLVRLPVEGERPLLPDDGQRFSDGELMEYARAVLGCLPPAVVEEYSVTVEHGVVIAAMCGKVPVHFVVSGYRAQVLPGPRIAALNVIAILRGGAQMQCGLPVCGITFALNEWVEAKGYAYVLLSEIKDSTPPMPE